MRRVLPAVLAVLAAALVVVAGLLPEFLLLADAGTPIEVVPLEGGRPAWLGTLSSYIVHAGILLVAAAMLVLNEAPRVAGGLLIGASLVGLSLRVARVLQLSAAPEFAPALGSWVDLGAEVLGLATGIWALVALRRADTRDEAATPGPPTPS